jgi:Tol biopolymer transport system component/DNA-binding winged helix-turn-helix (wHTH) protein
MLYSAARVLATVAIQSIKFEEFELDCDSYQLRRSGRNEKLERLPMNLLILLATKHDRLVTREEIEEHLWGGKVFVDSNLGINTAIRKIRQALRDDPDCPRFVETITGRGYKFVATISQIVETPSVQLPVIDEVMPVPPEPPLRDAIRVSSRPMWHWTLGVGFILVIGAAAWFMRPLSVLHISAYTQITHDGISRVIGGAEGSRLYLNRDMGEAGVIEQVSVTGGEAEAVPLPLRNPAVVGVTMDGSSLRVWDGASSSDRVWDGALYSLAAVGGTLQKLTGLTESTTRWSPDGSLVVYKTRSGDFMVAKSDGSEARRLAHDTGLLFSDLLWSPDSKSFRYCNSDGLIREISLTDPTPRLPHPGWRPIRYGTGSHWGFGQTWTPDGSFYIFTADDQVWAFDERHLPFRAASNKPFQLTAGPNVWNSPLISNDGKRLFASGSSYAGELVRYDSRLKVFLPFLGGISAVDADLSPDGQQVTYSSYPHHVLWRQNMDGSGKIRLSDSSMEVFMPRFSPDGKKIVFQNDFDSRPPSKTVAEILIVSAEGGKPQRILPKEDENETDPSFSPDGRNIVYANYPQGIIHILNLDTHQVTTLSDSEGFWLPLWSPDGRSIASIANDLHTLKIFDVKRQTWRELERGEVNSPAWSHDSNFIYFTRWQSEKGLFRVRFRDGRVERIADLTNFTHIDTGRMRLDATDAPFLTKEKSNSDIYALTLEEK